MESPSHVRAMVSGLESHPAIVMPLSFANFAHENT